MGVIFFFYRLAGRELCESLALRIVLQDIKLSNPSYIWPTHIKSQTCTTDRVPIQCRFQIVVWIDDERIKCKYVIVVVTYILPTEEYTLLDFEREAQLVSI